MDVPRRLGRFTIQSKIGESPSSVVSKAYDEGLQSEAIVKVIQLSDERFTNRCMRELERWQGLGIGGLQRVVEIGKVQGVAWYGADPVPGTTLQTEIDDRKKSGERWTDKQVYQIGRKVANLLDLLHGLQIVHTNLKPSNVLGRTDADLVLTDPGLTRATETSEIPNWLGGLPAYMHMSPDQLAGFKPLDAKTDIWQLGLLLYQVATFVHPFQNVESPQDLEQRVAKPIDPPDKVVPGFDLKLSRAIMLCLNPSREKRLPTVKDFLRHWHSVTAKYESLTDVPVAALNPDAARPTRKFSGPSGPRITGRGRMVSQPLEGIKEIKPTPVWVIALVVVLLAVGVGGFGFWFWTHETEGRLEGDVEQRPGFAGVTLTYRTNIACASAVEVKGEGTSRRFDNSKDGATKKHTVRITEFPPGANPVALIQLGEKSPPASVPLKPPPPTPFQHVRFEQKGDDLALAFTTPVKAKSSAHARLEENAVDLTLAAEPDTAHEGAFKGASAARLKELTLEATDADGEKRAASGTQLVAAVAEPLAKAVAAPPLSDAKIADPVAALDKSGVAPLIADAAALGGWPFETPDLSDEARRGYYAALNGLERALAHGGPGIPAELGMLKPLRDGAYLSGQVVTTSELAHACEGAMRAPATSPVALLVQLGVFSRLKPGLFTSTAARTRVAYDPKPQEPEASVTGRAQVHLQAPAAGEYRTAQLALAVNALPADALIIAMPGDRTGEVVLWNPIGRPAPPSGEQWIARFVPPKLSQGSVELGVRLEPVGTATPAPLKVLGALLIYR